MYRECPVDRSRVQSLWKSQKKTCNASANNNSYFEDCLNSSNLTLLSTFPIVVTFWNFLILYNLFCFVFYIIFLVSPIFVALCLVFLFVFLHAGNYRWEIDMPCCSIQPSRLCKFHLLFCVLFSPISSSGWFGVILPVGHLSRCLLTVSLFIVRFYLVLIFFFI